MSRSTGEILDFTDIANFRMFQGIPIKRSEVRSDSVDLMVDPEIPNFQDGYSESVAGNTRVKIEGFSTFLSRGLTTLILGGEAVVEVKDTKLILKLLEIHPTKDGRPCKVLVTLSP